MSYLMLLIAMTCSQEQYYSKFETNEGMTKGLQITVCERELVTCVEFVGDFLYCFEGLRGL